MNVLGFFVTIGIDTALQCSRTFEILREVSSDDETASTSVSLKFSIYTLIVKHNDQF